MGEADDTTEVAELARQAAAGSAVAWQLLIRRFHGRLKRMVALRMDSRMQGRVDPADVLQEAYIDAFAQLPEYVAEQKYPFFLWLRMVAGSRLAKLHRYHIGRQMRDVKREISIFDRGMPEASSAALAGQLLGAQSEPIEGAARAEMCARLIAALNQMDELDREALALRHFEHLTTPEVAQVLEISEAAAAKRYLRALERLRHLLAPS